MSGKNQFPYTLNWQTVDPRPGLLPTSGLYNGGSPPSGTLITPVTGTNTYYSNIICVNRMDNIGAEVAWTGTPTGTISYLVSASGNNWPSLTFVPALSQPNGSSGTLAVSLNQLPFQYLMAVYVNASGTGTLAIYLQLKDLN